MPIDQIGQTRPKPMVSLNVGEEEVTVWFQQDVVNPADQVCGLSVSQVIEQTAGHDEIEWSIGSEHLIDFEDVSRHISTIDPASVQSRLRILQRMRVAVVEPDAPAAIAPQWNQHAEVAARSTRNRENLRSVTTR